MPFYKGHKINLGRKPTLEAIENIRKSKLGNKNPRFGKPPWNKGLKGRQPWMNISGFKPGWNKGMFGVGAVGEKNGMWKGGITPLNKKIRNSTKYKIWRKAVFERDNYTCILCFKMGGYLEADHIKPFSLFPELRFEIDNGRTLCKPCHKETDTWGYKMNLMKYVNSEPNYNSEG